MVKQIECPNCGNTTEFCEDAYGIAQTHYYSWDEEEQAYKYQRQKQWEGDGCNVSCGKCERDLPPALAEQFYQMAY